jgi:predicted ArsR family transcriptional regulator
MRLPIQLLWVQIAIRVNVEIMRAFATSKSREKIIALLSEDSKFSAAAVAEKIGISAKAVEKHLSNLKAEGIIERIGAAKGEH